MKFGDYLLSKGKIKKEELKDALKVQTEMLDEKLVSYGVITTEDIEEDWNRFKQSCIHDRRIGCQRKAIGVLAE